jgi:hypothetical protein
MRYEVIDGLYVITLVSVNRENVHVNVVEFGEVTCNNPDNVIGLDLPIESLIILEFNDPGS